MDISKLEDAIDAAILGKTQQKLDINELEPGFRTLGKKINSLIIEKEKLYQSIKKMPIPLGITDTNFNILDVNEEFIELTGYSADKLKEMNISDFYSHFDLKLIEGKGTKEARDTKSKVSGKFTMKFKGVDKVIVIHSIPFLDESGNVAALNTALIDVTDIEEQKVWYESILDSLPFPVSVTDMNMKWQYLNPLAESASGISKNEAIGTQCSRWNANICGTGNCGIECLRRGKEQTFFDQDGKNFMVNVAWIRNMKGEKAGHVEIVQDITATKRVADYIETEVKNIGSNLEKIAAGDLNLDLTVGDGDEYTKEIRKDLLSMADDIRTVNTSIKGVISASTRLGNDIAKGIMKPVDSYEFNGAYKELIETLNTIPLNLKEPLDINLEYIEKIGKGEIPEKISKDFNGGYNNLKINLNNCIEGLSGLKEAEEIIRLMAVNDYTRKIEGNYQGIYGNIASEINNVQARLLNVIDVCEKTSKGDLSKLDEFKKLGKRSDNDILIPSLVRMMEALKNTITEISVLSGDIVEGKLSTKADHSRHSGAFADLIIGVNELLDAIILPVNEAIRMSDNLAKGDFTARFNENISAKGDILSFKEALNNVGDSVSQAIGEANKIAENVAIDSNEVSKGADEVAKAAEGVATTSQKTADLTRELLASIEEVTLKISDLSASNEEIASTSQEVFKAANQIVDIGKEAQGLANDTSNKMGSVEKIAKESVEEIYDLTDKIKEVSNVVKMINDITGQINLLALNAAIEAARAGEHGRGFAVVAGEVKNLAAEARAATDSIENVVSMVQVSSEKTANAINNSNNEIVDGVESVTKTIEVLNTIIRNAGQVTGDIGEITKAIEDQANIANNVVNSAEKGTKMTKEVQNEAEGLAALAEESSASVEEIGSAIHEVNELSNNLKTVMGNFRI
ncbi:PAS domain S-box protein [Methanoplanus sp. FWC-SCC4]|uniref:PAS domain S-box protein n=1 Tax=Methanochimaera problematica TaxID=2609417 RepID=A0AA97I4L1_9EURY|nr:methyl-accepting chemotaxis protein [Methanoplanus sp. FWC-SCC4]WOF16619.1 PAS domain S-box protein [Methanoplanus sp. FWC-SCC4]